MFRRLKLKLAVIVLVMLVFIYAAIFFVLWVFARHMSINIFDVSYAWLWLVIAAAGLVLLFLVVALARWLPSSIETLLAKQQEFVSDASHELKTPLTIINTNIAVLQNEVGKNQWFENIKWQSERMNRLVNDLLTLLKTANGQANIIKKRFNLSSTVLNLVLEIESRAFEKGKQYTFDIEENIFYAGNERLIKRLLGVLIDNAIGYSDKNGQIKTTLTKKRNRIYLSVFNTGIGVKTKDVKRIFERFYRVDESRSRETGGTGLGLPIAKAVADAHRGKITVTGVPSQWVKFELKLRSKRFGVRRQ